MSSLLSSGKTVTFSITPWIARSPSATVLTDGTINYGDSNWTLMNYRDFIGSPYYFYMTIDLGSQWDVAYVRFAYSAWSAAHVYSPSTIIIQGSNDGFVSDINDLGTFVRTTDWSSADTTVSPITARWSNNLAVSGIYQQFRWKCYWNDPAVWDTCYCFQELEIYGDPVSNIKTINGLAKASVKLVNGLAIASVKNIKGLA